MIYYITPEKWERIPDEYKLEHSERYGKKACFICFLTSVYTSPGTTLCFEKWHFVITDSRPEHTKAEERNGHYAIKCLTEKAQAAFERAENLTVWEYHGAKNDRLQRSLLYAYQYGEEYANDLTENDLIDFLEALGDKLEREERERLPLSGRAAQ